MGKALQSIPGAAVSFPEKSCSNIDRTDNPFPTPWQLQIFQKKAKHSRQNISGTTAGSLRRASFLLHPSNRDPMQMARQVWDKMCENPAFVPVILEVSARFDHSAQAYKCSSYPARTG